MTKTRFITTALLALAATVSAECGSGTPDAMVDGSEGAYTATVGGSGQRLTILASGPIGTNVVSIPSGRTFEGCGTIDVQANSGRGNIRSLNTEHGVRTLGCTFTVIRSFLGQITMNLGGGLGIRFERDEAASSDVSMDVIKITGAGSHAVETWNIDGLTINQVIAGDVEECELLLQTTTNARIGTVDGDNVATGTGYATFRMANANGRLSDGSYDTNVYVENVVARGGGRGVFCVSESGGMEIGNVDISDTENNAILIENCYGVSILGGTVDGGGDVRISARDEFPNTRDVRISLEVNGANAVENPCGENITWDITGDATLDVCWVYADTKMVSPDD
ncbi:hypothetical protein BDW66DRAFT_150977 [Aspergillus desertorum]